MRPSDSNWASKLNMVPKKDSSGWRPCGNYRALNDRTFPDRYPLPHIHDSTRNLTGITVYSKINLTKAYLEIPMKPTDIRKTTITAIFGLVEYVRMPFELRIVAQTLNASQIMSHAIFSSPTLTWTIFWCPVTRLRSMSAISGVFSPASAGTV